MVAVSASRAISAIGREERDEERGVRVCRSCGKKRCDEKQTKVLHDSIYIYTTTILQLTFVGGSLSNRFLGMATSWQLRIQRPLYRPPSRNRGARNLRGLFGLG